MSRKEIGILIGIALIALVLRVLLLLRRDYVISPDGVEYVGLAVNIAAGNLKEGFSTYWSPLYSLLTAAASYIFRDVEFSARAVSTLAGSLLVVPAYLIVRNLYGLRTAAIAALLVGLNPHLIDASLHVGTESVYTMLFVCGIITGWLACTSARSVKFLWTGMLFGACYLLKPEAFGYLGLLVMVLPAARLFRREFDFSHALRNAAALVGGFALLALPYLLYIHHELGAWTLSAKLVPHFMGGRFSESAPAASFISRVNTQFAYSLKAEQRDFLYVFPPSFMLLAGIGLLRRPWTRDRALKELYLILFVCATLIAYALTVVEARYFVPLLPILLGWAAQGVIELKDWLAETFKESGKVLPEWAKKRIEITVVALLILCSLPTSAFVFPSRSGWKYQMVELKRTGLWIADNAEFGGPLVMASDKRVAYYADGRYVPMPNAGYESLVAEAQLCQADFVVIDERTIGANEGLRSLLDEGIPHPGLKPVYRLDEQRGYKVVVYKLSEPQTHPITEGDGGR